MTTAREMQERCAQIADAEAKKSKNYHGMEDMCCRNIARAIRALPCPAVAPAVPQERDAMQDQDIHGQGGKSYYRPPVPFGLETTEEERQLLKNWLSREENIAQLHATLSAAVLRDHDRLSAEVTRLWATHEQWCNERDATRRQTDKVLLAGRENITSAWSSFGMIRDAIEELGPVGVLPSQEAVVTVSGPEFEHEADALIEGIRKTIDARESAVRESEREEIATTAPVPAAADASAWQGRDKPTPLGIKIWVSNGIDIWMVTGDGKVFPDIATACKWWIIADLPNLPSGAAPEAIED